MFDCLQHGKFPIVRRIAAQDVRPGINPNAPDLVAVGVGRSFRPKPKLRDRVAERLLKGRCDALNGKTTEKSCRGGVPGCTPATCKLAAGRGKLNLRALQFYLKYPEDLWRWIGERLYPHLKR